MADRDNERGRPTDSDRGRKGFGDDGGTRIGRPDPAQGADRNPGPSTQPVKEGLEGAVFESDPDTSDRASRSASSSDRGPTGAGAEAAEGTHGAQGRRGPDQRSSVDPSSSSTRGDADDRRGSEPLAGREDTHVSGYGGAGGRPKHSSDQREDTK